MKRTSNKPVRADLRDEYVLDYSKSKPNRFAPQLKDTKVVVLQPDVARIFRSSEAVNDLLRSAITATSSSHSGKQRPTSHSSERASARR
jgi:hypothetical protein